MRAWVGVGVGVREQGSSDVGGMDGGCYKQRGDESFDSGWMGRVV